MAGLPSGALAARSWMAQQAVVQHEAQGESGHSEYNAFRKWHPVYLWNTYGISSPASGQPIAQDDEHHDLLP